MALFDKLKSKLGIGRTENPAEPDKKEEKAVPEAPKAESAAPAGEIKPAAEPVQPEEAKQPAEEAPEAPDGRVYRGYFTEQDDFVKPVAQSGPPKFKSFGGKKKF